MYWHSLKLVLLGRPFWPTHNPPEVRRGNGGRTLGVLHATRLHQAFFLRTSLPQWEKKSKTAPSSVGDCCRSVAVARWFGSVRAALSIIWRVTSISAASVRETGAKSKKQREGGQTRGRQGKCHHQVDPTYVDLPTTASAETRFPASVFDVFPPCGSWLIAVISSQWRVSLQGRTTNNVILHSSLQDGPFPAIIVSLPCHSSVEACRSAFLRLNPGLDPGWYLLDHLV